MATFVIQKQDMVQGEERLTEEVIVPAGLTTVQIELDLNTTELRDPTTHVWGQLEWFDASVPPGAWRVVNAVELIGHPENDVRTIPYIRWSEADCLFFTGQRMRGRIVAQSAGRYGATVRAE